MAKGRRSAKSASAKTESYKHSESTVPMRPEIGILRQFKKQKPLQRYRYDSSLAPSYKWDGRNPAGEQSEAAIAEVLAQADVAQKAAASGKKKAAKVLEWVKGELLEQHSVESIIAAGLSLPWCEA